MALPVLPPTAAATPAAPHCDTRGVLHIKDPLCSTANQRNDAIQKNNFRFVPQILGGPILLPLSKIAPPNGSCVQDSAGLAVADPCRHLLICFAMCPWWAPAASFAWFCILIVLLYRFLQLFRLHSGTGLFKYESMVEQFCWRQNLGPPIQNDPKKTYIGGWGHKPPLGSPSKNGKI